MSDAKNQITVDRRSGRDRRRLERKKVNTDVEWDTSAGRHTGTLSDISELGCFILSGDDVEDGEDVKIFLPVSDDMSLELAGRIANHVFEIGFAVIFVDTNTAQKDFLTDFVATHKEL